MSILGNNLQAARKALNMSQAEVAKILRNKYNLKTDRVMISKWETGFQVPNMYAVKCLSEIYGISMDELNNEDTKNITSNIKIGNRIKERRMMLGMSQEELAIKTGYSTANKKSAISKIENNKNDLTRSQITRFAQALDTTEAYLMGWTDDPESQKLYEDSFEEPIIIAADTITTEDEPVIFHMAPIYDDSLARYNELKKYNPEKAALLQSIYETDLPDNVIEAIRIIIAPYKK